MSDGSFEERALEIYVRASELPEDQRKPLLDRECGADTALRLEVEALLRGDRALPPAVRTGGMAFDPRRIAIPLPERIGPYRIVDQIGEGGMGIVYRGEQEHPIRRPVAVKLIRYDVESPQTLARFEAERQAMALMNHPNIASVLDAGVTREGRPYVALEYIDGQPITEYCDQHEIALHRRLELFLSVCDAVHHAHQRAIIHRDLKPTNVLVAEQDDRPVPKIIDFGVAKAIDRRLTDRTLHTEAGQRIGTPHYMSPEQAEASGRPVDARSDVYALGVLLYELVVGELPFDAERLRKASASQTLQILRNERPPSPSARLVRAVDAEAKASRRGLDASRLSRRLAGDLDWVVLKAIENEPDRRYQTAAAFGADVGRFIEGQPVEARPPSALYVLRRFVGRHKVETTLAVALLLLVLGSAVAVTLQSRTIAVQRNRSDSARSQADAALDQVAAERDRADQEALGNRAVMQLVFALERLAERGPEVVAQVRDQSVAVISERAYRAVAGRPLAFARLLTSVLTGPCISEDCAMDLKWQTLEFLVERVDLSDESLVSVVETIAERAASDRREIAVAWYERLVAARRALEGPEARSVAKDETSLGRALHNLGRSAQALVIYERVLDAWHGRLGEDHPDILHLRQAIATAQIELGQVDAGVAELKNIKGDIERVFGPNDIEHLAVLYNIAVSIVPVAPDRAIDYLGEALNRGFNLGTGEGLLSRRTILEEPHFAPIRHDPRFLDLVGDEGCLAAVEQANAHAYYGRYDDAIRLLHLAIDRGLGGPAAVRRSRALSHMQGVPEFDAVLGVLEARKAKL